MKIVIVIPNSTIAHHLFYNSQEIGLSKALINLGISVDICVYSKKVGNNLNFVMLQEDGENKIRLLEYDGFRLLGQQAVSWVLCRYLFKKGKEYSIFQVEDSTQIMTVLAACIAKQIAVPCVLYQGMYRDFNRWWKKALQRIFDILFMKVLFASISMVVGKTTFALAYLNGKGLPRFMPAKVINVCLDTEVFTQGEKKEVGIECFDVLYIGQIEERRKPEFLAGLLLELYKTKKDFKACVIGDGTRRRIFVEKVKGLIASGHLIYVPKMENKHLPNIYKRSKVLLDPTTYEIFGMTILEAMYFGVPVIASAEAGPKEIISDGIDGILLEGFDLNAWKNAVISLIGNNQMRVGMGKRGSQKIRENFNWEYSALKFKEVYSFLRKYKALDRNGLLDREASKCAGNSQK